MPRWTSRSGATEQTQQRWDRYYKKLFEHEQNHKRIAKRGAKQMGQRMTQIAPQTSCDRVTAAARSIYHQETRLIQTRQKRYDAATQHGRREGIHRP